MLLVVIRALPLWLTKLYHISLLDLTDRRVFDPGRIGECLELNHFHYFGTTVDLVTARTKTPVTDEWIIKNILNRLIGKYDVFGKSLDHCFPAGFGSR